jgi:maleate isomerase
MHTGCSYVVGADGEAGLREALDRAGADHAFTAAGAVEATLRALGCRRLALVLPYPEWLCEAAVAYWEARGLTIAGVEKPRDVVSIYEITPESMIEATRRLDLDAADAVLLSGTGPPTLRALTESAPAGGIPVLSSNQCVAWHALGQGAAAGTGIENLSPPLRNIRDRLVQKDR